MEFALVAIPLYAATRFSGYFAETISEFIGGVLFWFFAITCTSVVVSGFLSILDSIGVLTALLIWLGISLLVEPRWKQLLLSVKSASRLDVVMFALVAWMTALIVAASWHYPPTPYDAYVYHLVFPARWLQSKSIFIIPTPFGDPASAYAPANGSSFYAYLMMLCGDDRLCKAGELIFWLISICAVYRLCELCGTKAFWKYVAVFSFAFSDEVIFQAASSEVDLIVAACGLWLFIALIRSATGDVRWLWAFGVALGLAVGTKFVALPLLFPILIASPFLIRGKNLRLFGGSLFLALVFGGVWYARNWLVTSNPIFPVRLDIFGLTLFWGPITVDGMKQSVFHIKGWDYKIAALFFLLGKNAWVFFVWSLIAGFIAAIAFGSRWTRLAILWSIFGLAIHFELIPYNSQYRFLVIFLALVWIIASDGLSRLSKAFGYIFAVPIFLGVVATLFTNPFDYELVLSRISIPVGGSGAFFKGAWWIIAISLVWFIFISLWAKSQFIAVTLIFFSSFGWSIAFISTKDILPIVKLKKTSFYGSRASRFYEELWKFEQSKRIAYTGFNGFYPLFAPDMKHSPFYVNASFSVFWKYHDYARWWKSKNLPLPPLPDKPALYRLEANRDDWLKNLSVLKPDLIAVYKLSAFEQRYIEHDEDGFPVEKGWLDSMHERYKKIFKSDVLVVYEAVY